MVKGLKTKVIFTTPSFKNKKKWLKIKMTYDPNEKGKEFYFAQRLGKDSVAFLLIDKNREDDKYQILKQYSSPYGKFQEGVFTGSLEKHGKSVMDHVIEEVKEEAGYDVDKEQIKLITSEEVGSSTNEIVHLYLVDITGLEQEIREPENIFEENMDRKFVNADYINNHCGWKSKLIIHHILHIGREKYEQN